MGASLQSAQTDQQAARVTRAAPCSASCQRKRFGSNLEKGIKNESRIVNALYFFRDKIVFCTAFHKLFHPCNRIASFADKACDKRTAWWAPFVAGKFISKETVHSSCFCFVNVQYHYAVNEPS
jgi:hypothetical protein